MSSSTAPSAALSAADVAITPEGLYSRRLSRVPHSALLDHNRQGGTQISKAATLLEHERPSRWRSIAAADEKLPGDFEMLSEHLQTESGMQKDARQIEGCT